jgi:hypothetical protein
MYIWLKKAADFLLAEWLWNVTHAIYLLPLSLILLFFLLKWVEHLTAMRALLLSLAANLFSFFIFTGFVVGVLIFIMRLEYIPPQEVYHTDVCDKLNVTLYLGLIHAALQSFFFFFMRKRFDLHMIRVVVLILISMGIAAMSVYLLLPKI